MKHYSSLCVIAGFLPLAVITGLFFVDRDFTLFANYISVLGTGQYGVIFNSSLVLAAVLSAPFLVGMRKGITSYMFIGSAATLAGVGLFPATAAVHWYFAAAFFLLIFASILVTGLAVKGPAGKISIVIGLAGFSGLASLNPAVETILVYAIGGWVMVAGLRYKKTK